MGVFKKNIIMAKVEIDIDIDEVFAALKQKERAEFIENNISEMNNDALADYVIENNIVTLDNFDDDDIVNYMLDKGYTFL